MGVRGTGGAASSGPNSWTCSTHADLAGPGGSPKRLEVFMHEHTPPKRGKGQKRAQSSGLPSLNQNISPLSTSPEQFACPESCREVVLLKQPIACCSGTQACRQQG